MASPPPQLPPGSPPPWTPFIPPSPVPACLCHSELPRVLSTALGPLLRSRSAGPTSPLPLLHSLTTLRRWIQALYTPSSAPSKLCPAVFKTAALLHQHKYWLLLLAHSLMEQERGRHVTYAAKRLFDAVAKLLPCVRGEECLSRCAPFVDRMLKADPGHHPCLEGLFQEVSLAHSLTLSCPSRCLRSPEASSWHEDTLKHAAVARIKSDWKRLVSSHVSSAPSETTERRLCFLNLWKTLVCIKTNIGIGLSREIIASSAMLVPELYREKPLLLWRKEVDVLQEVLCYGSTLALQSEVAPEVSTVAQALVKAALSSNFLMEPSRAPRVTSGFLGSRGILPPNRTPGVSMQFVQGLCLLLLKSTALILREATSCSSASEESDTSISSRGSSFCEEARLIERNVDCVLRATHSWVRALGNFHPNQSFGEGIVELFFDQDDFAIEALLCMVDIHQGLDYFALKVASLDFEPVQVFHHYMDKCSWDHSVLVDYLVSNETCFLLYLLKLLKSINKKPLTARMSEEMSDCLQKLENSLEKLVKGKLFPYNIDPIMVQLSKVNNRAVTSE